MGNKLTSFLYADPSFPEGIARVWDFGNHLSEYNISDSEELADYTAISADFTAVGNDIRKAISSSSAKLAQNKSSELLLFPA